MYGFVLEGGGAKGSYHIGVWKALRELEVEISAVTGTSIGAINGAFIALDMYDEVYDIWYNADMSMGVSGDNETLTKLVTMNFEMNGYKKLFSFIKKSIADGGLDVSPMKKMIEDNIDEEKLRKSKIDYGLVTISLTDFKPIEVFKENIPDGLLHDYIMASANLPIFKTDRVDGKIFLDGGFHDNLPINLMASKGYKDIIAVRGGGVGRNTELVHDDLNITYINPSGDTGNTMEFISSRTRENLKMGYYDTMKVFNKLKGNKYFIDTELRDEECFAMLSRISDEKIKKLSKIFGESSRSPKMFLFEEIVPSIAKMLKLGEESTYMDVFIALLEFIGQYYELDRYRILTLKEFIAELDKAFLAAGQIKEFINMDVLPDALKHTNLYKYSAKDSILINLFEILRNELKELDI
ncbi:MAG: patatin-like phospholipase family protein [Acidaminobacteraceae bacterium]